MSGIVIVLTVLLFMILASAFMFSIKETSGERYMHEELLKRYAHKEKL